ncbi:hypothetical protein PIB30_045628 [Stylosanthes scabra]|uniref:Uncharacterized protein n=1 Tax=Stylosanthes scabra TaxID=79078 RepID=A0ABU6UFJ2_9FABA|nr:hypothetical protein [Stylosanthes scabra]
MTHTYMFLRKNLVVPLHRFLFNHFSMFSDFKILWHHLPTKFLEDDFVVVPIVAGGLIPELGLIPTPPYDVVHGQGHVPSKEEEGQVVIVGDVDDPVHEESWRLSC